MAATRRDFMRVAGFGALGLPAARGSQAPAAREHAGTAATTLLQLTVRGGYVYVIRIQERETPTSPATGTVVFGPIAPRDTDPPEEQEVFVEHDLLLTVTSGQAYLPGTEQPVGPYPLRLTGQHVTFAPLASRGLVSLPPARAREGEFNGLDRLPDVIEQAGKSGWPAPALRPQGWPVETLVTLEGGSLEVIPPEVPDAGVQFGVPGTPDGTTVIVSDSVRFDAEFAGDLNILSDGSPLLIIRPDGGGRVHAQVRPRVELATNRAADGRQAASASRHFAMFYRLLEGSFPVAKRRVPHSPFLSRSSLRRTPGVFCPPGAYFIPP